MGTYPYPPASAGSAGAQPGTPGTGPYPASYPAAGPYGGSAPYGAYGPYGTGAYGPYGPQGGYPPQGPGGPQGPYGPGGLYGPPAPGPGPAPKRHGRKLATHAAVAVLAAAGSALAVTAISSGSPAGSASLTRAQIVAKTDASVVDVISTLGYQNGTAEGTGIVLTSNGLVLTNNHVINGATSVQVRDVSTGRVYPARVVGYDATHDVAVLQLQGASGLTPASLGTSARVVQGQKVVAIGNAGGTDGVPSVAVGRVTGLNQSITATDAASGSSEQLQGLLETNANIQPGDSGGPLVNAEGSIIGIDTAASSGSGTQFRSATTTQAFAIPINEALGIARQIEAGTPSSTVHIGATAFLGVEISAGSQSSGAPVAGVVPGSAAASAGLAGGDTITAVSGSPVSSPTALRALLSRDHPGQAISISWTDQSGQTRQATVVLKQGPSA